MATKYYLTLQDFLGRTIKAEIVQYAFDYSPLAGGGKTTLTPYGLPAGFRVLKKMEDTGQFMTVLQTSRFDKVTISIEARAATGSKQRVQYFDFFGVHLDEMYPHPDTGYLLMLFTADNAAYFEASVDSISFY